MSRLSAIIITKNEAANIAACLASVAFCDERIVVDSGSADDTVKIASRQRGAGGRASPGRATGRRRTTRCRWRPATGCCRSMPTSGSVQRSLPKSKSAIAAPKTDAYEIPRVTSFLGRDMKQAGGSQDFVLRLFRRGSARFTDDLVHERVVCDGPVARLGDADAAPFGGAAGGCAVAHRPLFDRRRPDADRIRAARCRS